MCYLNLIANSTIPKNRMLVYIKLQISSLYNQNWVRAMLFGT